MCVVCGVHVCGVHVCGVHVCGVNVCGVWCACGVHVCGVNVCGVWCACVWCRAVDNFYTLGGTSWAWPALRVLAPTREGWATPN